MTASPNSAATPRYSHGHQRAILASHSIRIAADSCAYFRDLLRTGPRVLDLGCGPCSITLDLAELVGPGSRMMGVDFPTNVVAAARADAESRGDTTTRFLVSDLFSVPVEPGSLGIVHAHQVPQHAPGPVAVLRTTVGYCASEGIITCRDADSGAMVW